MLWSKPVGLASFTTPPASQASLPCAQFRGNSVGTGALSMCPVGLAPLWIAALTEWELAHIRDHCAPGRFLLLRAYQYRNPVSPFFFFFVLVRPWN